MSDMKPKDFDFTLPPAQVTAQQLEEWFSACGCVRRVFIPPQVPDPPPEEETEFEQPPDHFTPPAGFKGD